MKIAIPTADGVLSNHFGHCEKFVLIEVDKSRKTIIKTEIVVPPPHEPCLIPKWLAEKNINIVIAGGMGEKAKDIFKEKHIEIIIGAESGTPEILAEKYLNGTIRSGIVTHTCNDHSHACTGSCSQKKHSCEKACNHTQH